MYKELLRSLRMFLFVVVPIICPQPKMPICELLGKLISPMIVLVEIWFTICEEKRIEAFFSDKSDDVSSVQEQKTIESKYMNVTLYFMTRRYCVFIKMMKKTEVYRIKNCVSKIYILSLY